MRHRLSPAKQQVSYPMETVTGRRRIGAPRIAEDRSSATEPGHLRRAWDSRVDQPLERGPERRSEPPNCGMPRAATSRPSPRWCWSRIRAESGGACGLPAAVSSTRARQVRRRDARKLVSPMTLSAHVARAEWAHHPLPAVGVLADCAEAILHAAAEPGAEHLSEVAQATRFCLLASSTRAQRNGATWIPVTCPNVSSQPCR
jgi:hypothetical protein